MKVRSDFVYVAASSKKKLFISLCSSIPHNLKTDNLSDATIFWTWGEAYSWCIGRKGWRPVAVAEKFGQRVGRIYNEKLL